MVKINGFQDIISIPVKLIKYIVTHYECIKNEQSYQKIIDEAIELNNMVALNILWRGTIHFTKTVPDMEHNVYKAVECANMDTIKFNLYVFMNVGIGYKLNQLRYRKLKKAALKNTDLTHHHQWLKIPQTHLILNSLRSFEQAGNVKFEF